MGITKLAKSIKILARSEYNVNSGKLVEIANVMNLESTKENLTLVSNKKIETQGKEGGVTHNDYSPPELKVEKSEVKLESKFAIKQLFEFAKKDSKAMFCFWMADIFGNDIPLEAYEKLYKDASDKKEDPINPKITVVLDLPGKGAAYYAGQNEKIKNHIIISEGFINDAIGNNNDQKLLMIALVEEFGHHLDYILRYKYSTVGGDAKNDEGAKYTAKMNRKYKQYLIDPFKVKEQHYATATIKEKEIKLVWDFADLHEKLKEYVDNRTEKDDNYFAGYEFFGAGLGDGLHGLGHQTIENNGLGSIDRYKNDPKGQNAERSQIYFGNWLRDFSQFIDPMVIRPMANALDALSDDYKKKNVDKTENQSIIDDLTKLKDNNNVTKEDTRAYTLPVNINFSILAGKAEIEKKTTFFSPVKLSREAVTSLVELIGIKEFGKLKVEKDNKEGKPQNFVKYLEDFRKSYAKVTTELLGVYKPQEHMDNPLALHPKFICDAIKEKNKKNGTNKACPPDNFNNKLDDAFVKDPVDSQWNNNKLFGTKNYIRGNGADPFESAFDCFLKYINKSDPDTVVGRMNFGAALHILEDYYAHSNFCEIAVMKVYDPEVFPWTNMPKDDKKVDLKKHKADFSSNSHSTHSVIDRSKIKYKTLNNPELWSNTVTNYMKGKDVNKVHPEQYYIDNGQKTGFLENKGQYYSHAECAIVQTGSFGMLDTLASIAPKINNKIFSIEVEDQKKMKEGERTFTDALIFELLKDISNAQSSDTKEKNTVYKGKDGNEYSDAFLMYLNYRDAMVKERVLGFSIKDVFSGFGIFDFVTNYIKVIQNSLYHFLALSAINLIDDYQTYLDNELNLLEQGNWKVNNYGPTHTQLAKDNGIQPLHHLAVTLAQEAVEKVGKLFLEKDGKTKIKTLATEVLFEHPMHTDWMDETVIKWCNDNKARVLLAHESSIVLYGIRHGYQEIAELYRDIGIISEFNTTPEQQKEFNSNLSKIPKAWNDGMQKLNKLWEKQGLTQIKFKTEQQSRAEALKESGHGK